MMSNQSSEETAKKEVDTGIARSKKLFFNSFIRFFSRFFRKHRKTPIKPEVKTISARALIDSSEKYCIIDLRSLDDFFKDHIIIDRKGMSFNLPYDSFRTRKKELQRFLTKKLLLYADEDSIARRIALELIADGFDVTVLIGGYSAYKQEMYS